MRSSPYRAMCPGGRENELSLLGGNMLKLLQSISFAGHRLLDPSTGEEQMRRQLKRRAFDHLLR